MFGAGEEGPVFRCLGGTYSSTVSELRELLFDEVSVASNHWFGALHLEYRLHLLLVDEVHYLHWKVLLGLNSSVGCYVSIS